METMTKKQLMTIYNDLNQNSRHFHTNIIHRPKAEIIGRINELKRLYPQFDADENTVCTQQYDIHLKPLIKWSGGKSDEIEMFRQYMQPIYKKMADNQITTFIEPFIGGGSLFFNINAIPSNSSSVNSILKSTITVKNVLYSNNLSQSTSSFYKKIKYIFFLFLLENAFIILCIL